MGNACTQHISFAQGSRGPVQEAPTRWQASDEGPRTEDSHQKAEKAQFRQPQVCARAFIQWQRACGVHTRRGPQSPGAQYCAYSRWSHQGRARP